MNYKCSYAAKARMLGYRAKHFNEGFYFIVNPKVEGDVIHDGGKSFKKGMVYDAVIERIPRKRFQKMMKLKMGKINFFIKPRR